MARLLSRAPGPAHAARCPPRWSAELKDAQPWDPEAGASENALDALIVAVERGQPDELARRAAAAVREGGLVALVGPVATEGGRGALQRTFGLVTRTPIHALEDLCAALLAARVTQLQVLRVSGARAEAIVYGVRVA